MSLRDAWETRAPGWVRWAGAGRRVVGIDVSLTSARAAASHPDGSWHVNFLHLRARRLAPVRS
jgi:hypothetical protein